MNPNDKDVKVYLHRRGRRPLGGVRGVPSQVHRLDEGERVQVRGGQGACRRR
ncbi:MAG: hypothetical protein MZV63_50570 [Marinilabiliales bacterium]|nr:hypothetical protein [Marinilabiliales bacterium]